MSLSQPPLVHSLVLDHVVLEVRDPDRSAAFYGDVLGLAPVRIDEFRRGLVKFPSLRVSADALLDLFPPPMWRGAQASNPNHICFTTSRAGMAALRTRLVERAIPVTHTDDHNFGARGFGRSIYFEDPDRLSVEVRYYEQDEDGAE